jgi:hypothetical protein
MHDRRSGRDIKDSREQQRWAVAAERVMEDAAETRAKRSNELYPQDAIPKMEKDAGPNSRRTMIADNVVTFPTVSPNTALARTIATGSLRHARTLSAAAASSSTPQAVIRWMTRSANGPRGTPRASRSGNRLSPA